ncbi:MAG: hypothetical protein IIU70_02555 [Anaerotignum sp.]|nr:hypothetical protein [Anaerotignum sp.]
MAKTIYMEVTPDALSLPVDVADNVKELAEKNGMTGQRIHEMIWHGKTGRTKHPRFVKVEVEEDEQDL